MWPVCVKGEDGEKELHIIVATHSQCIEAFLVHLGAFPYSDRATRGRNKNCTMSTIERDSEGNFVVRSVFQDLTEAMKKVEGLSIG